MVSAMRTKVAANAHLGHLDEARAELGRLLAIDPKLTIAAFLRAYAHILAPEVLELWVTGLRLAGLPEMSGERVERRLAAILAADVAGYSRLMGDGRRRSEPTVIDRMRPRKSGSQETLRWREMDSNSRSRDDGITIRDGSVRPFGRRTEGSAAHERPRGAS
jgi:hypothetical protein